MGADGIDAPPQAPDSPLPGSDTSFAGPDTSPQRDEGTATDLDLRPIQDIKPVHRAPARETTGDADPVATTDRDELTAATDAADPLANAKGPDSPASALPSDEGHALNEPDTPADRSRSLGGKIMHGVATIATVVSGVAHEVVPPAEEMLSRLPPAGVSQTMVSAAENVGTISDAKDEAGNLVTEVKAVIGGEPDQPGIGGGAAEHPVTEPNPEIPVDEAPDPAGPDDPESPISDDLKTLLDREKDREEENAEADKAALERRLPDRFPRAQNSPKISDQVRDRRPTPTGRGQSRGRPK